MFEDWVKLDFSRLPTVYEEFGYIDYKIFLKKDLEGKYWLFMYSVKMPAYRYVGRFHEKWNIILDSMDAEKISDLLKEGEGYISYGNSDKLENVFEAYSYWRRNPYGRNRIADRYDSSIQYCNLEDYLRKYTEDESVIKDIVDGLGVFCK